MTELNGIVLSRLPVLRLAPLKEERGNCPFLTGNHCAIHDAEPLVCALYPLAQEITKDGQVSYFLQPTHCGKGGGLSGPLRCARPGGHRCALGAGVHGVGGYRGAAGGSV